MRTSRSFEVVHSLGSGCGEMDWDFAKMECNFVNEVFREAISFLFVSISFLLLFVSFFKVSMVLSLSWIPFFISWVW